MVVALVTFFQEVSLVDISFDFICLRCTPNNCLLSVSGNIRLPLLLEELRDHILDSLKYVYSDKEPNIRDKSTETKKEITLSRILVEFNN